MTEMNATLHNDLEALRVAYVEDADFKTLGEAISKVVGHIEYGIFCEETIRDMIEATGFTITPDTHPQDLEFARDSAIRALRFAWYLWMEPVDEYEL